MPEFSDGRAIGRLTWARAGIVVLHVVALGAWWGKGALGAYAPADGTLFALNMIGVGLGAVGLLALLAYQALPPPDRDSERPRFDRRSVALHLLYTWSLATCLALWAFAEYRLADHETPHEEALKVWFLALGFFAGFLNLTRSTGTRSTASTIHATTRRMATQLDLMRRGQQTNAELFAHAVSAQLAKSREELVNAVVQMVDAARAHPTIPPDRLTVSLWVRDVDQWRIMAGSGISDETRDRFHQPILEAPRPGAGMVANLTASDERVLVEPQVEKHRWYTPNPYRDGAQSGIALVVIENFKGLPIAALCLTARPGTLMPHRTHDPEAYDELMRLLMAWKIAFTLPMVRLIHIERPEPRNP